MLENAVVLLGVVLFLQRNGSTNEIKVFMVKSIVTKGLYATKKKKGPSNLCVSRSYPLGLPISFSSCNSYTDIFIYFFLNGDSTKSYYINKKEVDRF